MIWFWGFWHSNIKEAMHLVFDKPCDSTSILKAFPSKLDIKRHSPSIFYISTSLAIQQAFSEPSLVNLITKDTHLVFSISITSCTHFPMFSSSLLFFLISLISTWAIGWPIWSHDVISNNVEFWHEQTQTRLCSFLLSLETLNDFRSIA